jgi:ankyrin repeat protein
MADIYIIKRWVRTTLWLTGGVVMVAAAGSIQQISTRRPGMESDGLFLMVATGFLLAVWCMLLLYYCLCDRIYLARHTSAGLSDAAVLFSKVRFVILPLLLAAAATGFMLKMKPTSGFLLLRTNDLAGLEKQIRKNDALLQETDKDGFNLLLSAIDRECSDFIDLLLAHGMTIRGSGKGAIEQVWEKSIRSGLQAGPNSGSEPGPAAALLLERPELLRQFLEEKADPDSTDSKGRPLLHQALLYRQTETVHLLLEYGASVEFPDVQIPPPLYTACKMNSPAVAMLLGVHADPNEWDVKDGNLPLHWATIHNNASTAKALLDAGAHPVPINHNGEAPLHMAAECNALETAQVLLNQPGNVDIPDKQHITPLLRAIRYNHPEMVQLLIENGADVNLKHGIHQNTPLHYAVFYRKTDIAKLLIQSGADLHATEHNGKTPLDFMKKINAVELLHFAGALPAQPPGP